MTLSYFSRHSCVFHPAVMGFHTGSAHITMKPAAFSLLPWQHRDIYTNMRAWLSQTAQQPIMVQRLCCRFLQSDLKLGAGTSLKPAAEDRSRWFRPTFSGSAAHSRWSSDCVLQSVCIASNPPSSSPLSLPSLTHSLRTPPSLLHSFTHFSFSLYMKSCNMFLNDRRRILWLVRP